MTLIAIMRAIHILSGVIWAGFGIVLSLIIFPGLTLEGRGALGQFMGKSGSRTAGIAAGLTFLSGAYLMWRLHWGEHSATAITLGIGAALAILAAIIGGAVSGRSARALTQLTPGPDTAAQATALRNRMASSARLMGGLLLLSVTCMAIARYI